MRRLLGDDRGQVVPIVAVSLLGLLAVTGLVIDGGFMFSSRRQLQGLADGSARAAAMMLDENVLRETGGQVLELDAKMAEQAAETYLRTAGFNGRYEVSAGTNDVSIRLFQTQRTLVMSLFGVRELDAAASATAQPESGP